MPYTKEQKAEWRKRNRDKARQYKEKHREKLREKTGYYLPEAVAARTAAKEAAERKRLAKEQAARKKLGMKLQKIAADPKCNDCGETKPKAEFYADKSRLNGVARRCKECDRARALEYRASDEYNSVDREMERVAARTRKKEAGYKGIGKRKAHKLSGKDFKIILAKFGAACFKCRATEELQFDHHLPLKRGGVHSHHNTVVLCKSCNGTKRELSASKFYTAKELRYLTELLSGDLFS